MRRLARTTLTVRTTALALALALVSPAFAQTPSAPAAPHPNPYAFMPAPMPPAQNPFLAMWMSMQWMSNLANHFMGPMMDEATRFRVLDAMMRAANPALLLGPGANGEAGVPPRVPVFRLPGFPTQTLRELPANTVSDDISAPAKRSFYQSMMMMNPLSLRDMISIMAEKMPVAEGVTFEDAVDSMRLRANEVNFKFVGHSPLWRDVAAISGDESTPRVEIFHFCDAVVARQMLDYVPEFVVFLPCRIALLEDADGKLWVMTLDWDVNWVNYAQNPNSELDEKLRAEAKRIRDALRYIMQGAATGDF